MGAVLLAALRAHTDPHMEYVEDGLHISTHEPAGPPNTTRVAYTDYILELMMDKNSWEIWGNNTLIMKHKSQNIVR